ncbi:MAG: alpha/beta hydrolase [Butyrivibrio sp.]|nr:alpha/beta hydrolase [Butyrivibrio sp.]
MAKKNHFLFLGFVSAIVGGGAVLGNYLYNLSSNPKTRFSEEGSNKEDEIMQGRLWIRDHERRQDLYIDSLDKLRLHASYISTEKESHKYAILIHGIHDNNEEMGVYAKHYYDQGINILTPDLRGHGQSEGTYAGYGYYDRMDIMEWIYWIIKRDANAKIFLHGVSMGAATTLMTTGEHLPANVVAAISDSSFTAALEEFVYVYKKGKKAILPSGFMTWLLWLEIRVRAGYDIKLASPIKAVVKSKTPTLFIHGDEDGFIPPNMCARLFEAAQCEKEYCIILGADHIKGVIVDPSNYWKKIDNFIKSKI